MGIQQAGKKWFGYSMQKFPAVMCTPFLTHCYLQTGKALENWKKKPHPEMFLKQISKQLLKKISSF